MASGYCIGQCGSKYWGDLPKERLLTAEETEVLSHTLSVPVMELERTGLSDLILEGCPGLTSGLSFNP